MAEDTKNRILEKAIDMFNEHGFENVSMRNLSEALLMSPGNLTYHFSKKQDIFDGILSQLRQEHVTMQYQPEISLKEFDQILIQIAQHQKKYAFYYKNIVELRKKYPEVAQLQKDYKEEFYKLIREVFAHFEYSGWMKKEYYVNQYDDLAVAVLSIPTFWTQLNMNRNMSAVIWSILLPNLTNLGVCEYKKIESKA